MDVETAVVENFILAVVDIIILVVALNRISVHADVGNEANIGIGIHAGGDSNVAELVRLW